MFFGVLLFVHAKIRIIGETTKYFGNKSLILVFLLYL